jgi:cell division inhibitor SepF
MSTLHKVKAYFGEAPTDYDDEYYEDDDCAPRASRAPRRPLRR